MQLAYRESIMKDVNPYTKMIMFYPETLQVATAENQSSEVGINGLQEGFCGREVQISAGDVLVSSVAVDADLFSRLAR